MEKLLKVFKVVFYVLLFALAITFVVCIFAIPTETKEFVKGAMVFLNQPLPIIGISILTLGFLVYKIIDVTPIGRKGYNAIKSEFKKEQDKINGYKQVAEEKLDYCEKLANEQIAILSDYSKELDNLSEYLAKVCETSPNAKIKALGVELTTKQSSLQQEIKETYTKSENELAEKVNNAKYDIDTILNELKALKEKVYGEETKDN